MKVKRKVAGTKAATAKEMKELAGTVGAFTDAVNAMNAAVTELLGRVTVLETAQVELAKRLEKVEATVLSSEATAAQASSYDVGVPVADAAKGGENGQ